MDISEARSIATFQRLLVEFAADLDFGLASAVVVTEVPGGETHVARIGNTPPDFVQASENTTDSQRDPVMKRLKKLSVPFLYDQRLYVREHASDLWEAQAQFGYRSGIAVALHLPGHKHFLLGFDRDKALPSSDEELTLLLGTLQLLAVHAQDAALRLLTEIPSSRPPPLVLTRREQEVLRLMAKGMKSKEVATAMNCSVPTVSYHLRNIYSKLGVTGRSALLKAVTLNLI